MPERARELDASVRAFRLQGMRLAALGDGYRRNHGTSVDELVRISSGAFVAMSYRAVTVWDLSDDRDVELARFRTPHKPVAVSPDGTCFVLQTARIEGTRWTDDPAWLWTPEHGRIATLEGAFDLDAAFFPDGSFAAASRERVFWFDRDGRRVRVADVPIGERGPYQSFVRPIECFDDGSAAVIVNKGPSGLLLVAWDREGAVHRRSLPDDASRSIARYRGDLLVSGRSCLHRFDPRTLEPRGQLTFDAGGTVVADERGIAGGSVVIVDGETGDRRSGRRPPYGISCLAFSADGRRLVGSGIGGTISVWDRATGAEIAPVEKLYGYRCLVPLPGGGLAAGRTGTSAGASGEPFTSWLEIVDGETLTRRRQVDCGIHGGVSWIAAAPDETIAAMTADGRLVVCPPDGDAFSLPADEGSGAGVLWRPNGELMSLGLDTAVLWNARARRELRREPRRFGTITTPLFEHSWETEDTDFADELLSCSPDGRVGVLSVMGDELQETSWLFEGVRREPFAPGRKASAAALHADGTWAAIAFERTVELWAPGETAPRATAIFDERVSALAISPDGRHWAASQIRGRIEVRVGAAEAPAAYADLGGADDHARALAFLPDGSLVAATERGNLLRFVLAA